MSKFSQGQDYGVHVWPSGLSVAAATFSVTPEELSARTGIAFAAGCDDLDYYRAAGVMLPSGRHVNLIWHERAPVQALVAEVDAGDDPDAARQELCASLGIAESEVTWRQSPQDRAI